MPKIEMDLPEVEGYEYTGKYGYASPGDYYLCNITVLLNNYSDSTIKQYPILKKKRWRAGQDGDYHTIRDGEIGCFRDGRNTWDDTSYASGMYWQTLEEGEAALAKFTAMLLGESNGM